MAKTDKCVVRNQAYRAGEFNIRERHNERKNESYHNGDIVSERSALNMHFKQCGGTYEQEFNKMLADGTISTHGLGKDPKLFDELVFDVNTSYFDRNGGYEYAKEFFEETYRLAVKEAGGEQYVLSAVMHADERNKALSEELGRDVFHYHLHVAYVPVVDKELKFKKNNKNPELAGKTKGFIKQVSHSKKWPREMQYDKNGEVVRNKDGKAVLVNSYSLLQDRFHEHMRAAGFTDFERGERGSTAEHLSVLDYKIQQDKKAVAALGQQSDTLNKAIQGKAQEAATLDKQVSVKQKRLSVLDKKIAVEQKADIMVYELESIGRKKTLLGKPDISPAEWEQAYALAREGISSRGKIHDLDMQLKNAQQGERVYKSRWETISEQTKAFRKAYELSPQRVQAAIDEIIRQGREQQTPTRPVERKRTNENEL